MKTLKRLFFFFQAEDGIRDRNVTGVQTVIFRSRAKGVPVIYTTSPPWLPMPKKSAADFSPNFRKWRSDARRVAKDRKCTSEEGRVGKRGGSRWCGYT